MTRRAARSEPDDPAAAPAHDRPWASRFWYEVIRLTAFVLFTATGGFRSGGRHNMPAAGGILLISNHVSFLDVFVLGVSLHRQLNYVARSTLFVPVLGAFIRSVGGFPIQRDGMGASGLKETLRRLRNGGVVILFPEGTRSEDGRLGALKSGISVLAKRARVPIVPAAMAGSFEAWPRHRLFPRPHPIRIEYGPAIYPAEVADLPPEAVTALLHDRILDCHRRAIRGLAFDLGVNLPPPDVMTVRDKRPLGESPGFD